MDWNNEPGFDRKRERYIQLDLNAWLRKHGIEDEGRKQGAANQPATDADELDATEADILAWVNRRARVCRDNVGGHLADLERDLADMENDEQLVTLRQRVGEMEGDAKLALERKVDDGRNALASIEQAVREDSAEFRAFRHRNGLTRQVDYTQRGKALPFIVICFVIEIVLNASLLMEVNAFGLIGSTAQMALISAVNVLLCGLALGAMLRQGNRREVPRKLAAWLGILALLPCVFVFNLAVGHFRDSMAAVVNNPGSDLMTIGNDALVRFAANPVLLDSFQSYLLALLGFLFFCVASWKWLQRDDPFPGYGPRHRQLERRKNEYLTRYDRAHEELRTVFVEHESKLADIREQLEIKLSKWRQIRIRGRNLVTEFPVHVAQYPHDLEQLLRAYRSANVKARSAPPPRHFKTRLTIDANLLNTVPPFEPPRVTNLTEVMQRVHDAVEQVQESYRDATRRYPILEKLIAGGES